MEKLSENELITLIKSVFPLIGQYDSLAIIIDMPRDINNDNKNWQIRRRIAADWYNLFKINIKQLGIKKADLIVYPDVGSNNADLPEYGYLSGNKLPLNINDLGIKENKIAFNDIFKEYTIILAPTEFSTTAPLKNGAKEYKFRAATMPGFSSEMIPSLRIDYGEVFRRVKLLKEILDSAVNAEVSFIVDNNIEYRIDFDLRFRKSHMSSGRFPDLGTAGNLPSGETYIVPYEGESDEKSGTKGTLPVQIGEDILFYTIVENKAIEVIGNGENFIKEERHLIEEPAYGNMAELGFGVLGDFGLSPINEILLDEKLGFHIAFGRSDHFGGNVSPSDFSSPDKVIHLDRVYINEIQPRISINYIKLTMGTGKNKIIMENNNYKIF